MLRLMFHEKEKNDVSRERYVEIRFLILVPTMFTL